MAIAHSYLLRGEMLLVDYEWLWILSEELFTSLFAGGAMQEYGADMAGSKYQLLASCTREPGGPIATCLCGKWAF